jgi:DNA polymerase III delta prime subunit
VSDLIASIKASKLPIICICNDKYKQALKSLKNHCLEIGWNKPTKIQVSKRLTMIAQAEGLSMNQVCCQHHELTDATSAKHVFSVQQAATARRAHSST